jgi:hypothetical protein
MHGKLSEPGFEGFWGFTGFFDWFILIGFCFCNSWESFQACKLWFGRFFLLSSLYRDTASRVYSRSAGYDCLLAFQTD